MRRAWAVSAAEARALLGVTRATLYAYVSRGFIRSQARRARRRASAATRATTSIGCGAAPRSGAIPTSVAAHALQWGMPVLESAITLIDGERLLLPRPRRRRAGANARRSKRSRR